MNIFVYGTLRDEALRIAVSGIAGDVTPARLDGYSVQPAVGDVAPMITPVPGVRGAGAAMAQPKR